MRHLRIVITLTLLIPLAASAARFPDVPDGHMYQSAIEALASAGIINGNPNGTFMPGSTVNRAAMLKMLYKAAGLTPDPASAGCFKDVTKESWYEMFVCDAVKRGIIQGFNDNTFRPAAEVTRTQAVKMTMLAFSFPVHELTDQTKSFLKFIDVATSAWYTKFLNAAFELHVLPIAGQTGSYFYPDRALLRGEAAATIYNALQVKKAMSASTSSAVVSQTLGSAHADSSSSHKIVTEPPPAVVFDVKFPWSDTRVFDGKKPASYRFTLDAAAVVAITTVLKDLPASDLTCRLYRLTNEGYSLEYYIGINDGTLCRLLVALKPGMYQLQLQSGQAGATYKVETKVGKGDGNDGFSQAVRIQRGVVRTESLDSGDLMDFFTFTVADTNADAPPMLTLQVTGSTPLPCLVYPMEDVDIYGFAGPVCGEPYAYPFGTYVFAVGHSLPLTGRQTYTIQLK